MFFGVLIGLGLGPPAVGLLSDLLRPSFGEESLRWALVASKTLPFWGVFHLWLASRTFREEIKGDPAAPETGPKHAREELAAASG